MWRLDSNLQKWSSTRDFKVKKMLSKLDDFRCVMEKPSWIRPLEWSDQMFLVEWSSCTSRSSESPSETDLNELMNPLDAIKHDWKEALWKSNPKSQHFLCSINVSWAKL